MSVRFDNIDLNSEANTSESTVEAGVSNAETLTEGGAGLGGVDEGLGSLNIGNSGEAVMGHVGRDKDIEIADILVGDEIAVNGGAIDLGLEGNVSNSDWHCGDLIGFDENGGAEKNLSTFSEEKVVDRSGESVLERDEVEGKVVMHCREQGVDWSAGLHTVELDLTMGIGGVVNLDLAGGDTISIQTEIGSGSLHDGVKPDSSRDFECADELADGGLHLVMADGNRKSGSGVDNGGTEVMGDTDTVAHSADAAVPHVNGFGSNGTQGLLTEYQMKDIEHLQDIKEKNVKQANLKMESEVEDRWKEKECQFHATDLVWGKVRSHPWWPGQIFDPSDASEKARRYSKKDTFLIAYFGDQTFAWNEALRIKPFREHFSQMEKQSNTESFRHAVECALEEITRRVEFGLACSCLSEEVYDKIKTQILVNAGIREESSRRDSRDKCLSAASFKPVNIVQYLKALAQPPHGGIDRLEFIIARSQVLAFNRWKGFYQLPEFKMLDGLLEDSADAPVMGERKLSEGVTEDAIRVPLGNEQIQIEKGNLVIEDTFSGKRKKTSSLGVSPSKKERRMADLMSRSPLNLSNGEGEYEGKAGRKFSSSTSVKKRKASDSVPDDSRVKIKKASLSPMTKKQFSRVGENIRRAATQLAKSTPILKAASTKKLSENGSNKRPSRIKSEKSQRGKVIPLKYPPPAEMLSQLYIAARDPMKGYNNLGSSVSFFSDYRNSFCIENSTSREHTKSTGKVSGKQIGKMLFNSETTETSGLEGMEDSYWTDRIVQSNNEEQVLFEPGTPNAKGSPTVEPEAALESSEKIDLKQESELETALRSSTTLDNKQESAHGNCEWDGEPASSVDEKSEEEYTPTALILNFTDLDSLPSESNLNKIFSHYGPLNESETEVLKKSKRAKVIFKRRSDAETAFSSTGKFSTFGPSLVSYRLNYLPSTQHKTPTSATKRSRKDARSVDGVAVDR